MARPCERDVAGRVTRNVENVQGFAAKGNGVAFVDETIDSGWRIGLKAEKCRDVCKPLDHKHIGFVDGERRARFFLERCDAPNVVKMPVRGDDFDDFEVVVCNELQDGIDTVAGSTTMPSRVSRHARI